MKRIAIVMPCYNEEQALPLSLPRILSILDRLTADGMIAPDSFILCCNDGSQDATWKVIESFHMVDQRVKGISLAHNRGHQAVLLAGLMTVKDMADAAISIDADLQDDPEAIVEMVRKFLEGKEIVYGVRKSRAADSWFKRTTARGFYKFQKRLGVDIVYDHADYRLMSARALEMLSDYGETNLFLRGLVPSLGLEQAVITYDRDERIAGESKYPLGKMLSFSLDGITSFSARPMRFIFLIGLVLLVLDLGIAAYVALSNLGHHTESGWTSLMLSVWFLGSLMLISIGIIGEYIGKIYMEVKHRPRYAIKDRLLD